ncbi:phosphate signaling complex protein PhoU [Malikia sp.]|uniref:phosphate signaling complex protein PhoU n=1 Tax=Malikia sp. TaxID=2070706 RepID=UPI002635C3B7|nr:phosphate signaling complex protein PhoU [Malikia sp.]MDD2728783.1 phosphate signaling complex protein PhoU [Malikia sp.]
MVDKHISSQFDSELTRISTKVLEMGGVVESQLQQVLYALSHLSAETCQQVLEIEDKVNHLEVEIDHDITSTMSRRQPTARDLRLLVGTARIIINLERAGDEICTIAKMLKSTLDNGMPRALPTTELRVAGSLAADLLHQSLDSYARMDVHSSLSVIKGDEAIDVEHEGLMRKLLTYMMEDPRTITSGLNLMFLARAIERVGDHAANIAEAVIYIAKGADVRHTTEAEREAAIK